MEEAMRLIRHTYFSQATGQVPAVPAQAQAPGIPADVIARIWEDEAEGAGGTFVHLQSLMSRISFRPGPRPGHG